MKQLRSKRLQHRVHSSAQVKPPGPGLNLPQVAREVEVGSLVWVSVRKMPLVTTTTQSICQALMTTLCHVTSLHRRIWSASLVRSKTVKPAITCRSSTRTSVSVETRVKNRKILTTLMKLAVSCTLRICLVTAIQSCLEMAHSWALKAAKTCHRIKVWVMNQRSKNSTHLWELRALTLKSQRRMTWWCLSSSTKIPNTGHASKIWRNQLFRSKWSVLKTLM